MASPSAASTARVEWLIQTVSLGGMSVSLTRLKIRCYLGTAPPSPHGTPQEGWLDTGAPLSVIPFHVHNAGLSWQPIAGVRTTWSGQPSDLGRVNMWLATDQPPYLRGPFSLLAKFARSDPPGPPVPVLIGLEFFLTHQAESALLPLPQDGFIRLP
jgi:hypothetical protein